MERTLSPMGENLANSRTPNTALRITQQILQCKSTELSPVRIPGAERQLTVEPHFLLN